MGIYGSLSALFQHAFKPSDKDGRRHTNGKGGHFHFYPLSDRLIVLDL
jgi:hypothetical protein